MPSFIGYFWLSCGIKIDLKEHSYTSENSCDEMNSLLMNYYYSFRTTLIFVINVNLLLLLSSLTF